ncbi:probable aspartic proteinase GIP2 [Manihot esculenta]|uniref:Peptidase A1 domain-containing protein n=1 Tax=Manihot esculenta TaxID=3983 RepID=A0A2C9WB77_MANES|nr:probable aspartic proteinase GIP2 [Manihot esculenta]OAY55840.1 hypothetical protein MANES_03G183900v8 [Manihot esculenta]
MEHSYNLLVFFSLLFFINPSTVQSYFRPKALLLPVSKDPSTLQYLVQINQRTPSVPLKLTLDLGGQHLWVDCEQGYVSSSYNPVPCKSAQCSLFKFNLCVTACLADPQPGCNNNTCVHFPGNTVTHNEASGEVAQDVVSIQSTDGSNPGRVVSVSKMIFTCGVTHLLDGLASGVKGMAGLGRAKTSLPSQFSAAFSFDRKFAICLSSSTKGNGVVFFGDGPYVLLPSIDVSKSLVYTPLIRNPNAASLFYEGGPSSEYFIGVKGININGKAVALNTSLLTIDKEGIGGTKISTVDPYTVMERTIFKAVTKAFIKELAGVPRVAPVAPFRVCFNSANIGSTRVGPAVPQIDFVLQRKSVLWSIFGVNSMVRVKDDMLCLGFVDGGVNPRSSIVIGGYQLENHLLQFDLATAKLGFSSLLLFGQTTCANFNFTSVA